MRAVIQKVKESRVKVGVEVVGKIKSGLVVLLAIHKNDKEEAIYKMAEKILNLRIFEDSNAKMNLSLKSKGGGILVVSQFTLYGDCNNGNRPGFTDSAKSAKAIVFYKKFVNYLRDKKIKVETGEFGAMMEVKIINDGPTTIIIDI